MPTMGKMLGAVAFAALGYAAAMAYLLGMRADAYVGSFREGTAVIGFFCGWFVMGNSLAGGWKAAAGSGMKTAVALAFWSLLFFSIYRMVTKSLNKLYKGPMEALTDIFALMLEFGAIGLTREVLGTLMIGGIIGGLVAKWGSRRFD